MYHERARATGKFGSEEGEREREGERETLRNRDTCRSEIPREKVATRIPTTAQIVNVIPIEQTAAARVYIREYFSKRTPRLASPPCARRGVRSRRFLETFLLETYAVVPPSILQYMIR